jgi:hypothetical protein
MRHFIITAIIVLAAAKAKAEVKDNLTNQERRDKSEGKRVVAIKREGYAKKSLSHKNTFHQPQGGRYHLRSIINV